MSGGHFDYQQFRMEDLAEEIREISKEYPTDFSEQTLDKFAEACHVVRLAAAMIHRIDWLVSGDDGEDSFHRRWAEDVEPLRGQWLDGWHV